MTSESVHDAFAIFVGEFAKPEALGLGQESGQPIDLVVEQVENGRIVQRHEFTATPDTTNGKRASGQVRVNICGSNSTSSFRAQGLVKELAEGTEFSGFAVRGKIRPHDESQRVRVTGLTYRHNVWEWDNEFRC